jgi:hypothetical protein
MDSGWRNFKNLSSLIELDLLELAVADESKLSRSWKEDPSWGTLNLNHQFIFPQSKMSEGDTPLDSPLQGAAIGRFE